MADLMIGYLQNIALHVIDHMRLTELLHEEVWHEALQMPMFDDNLETHASRCQMDFDFKLLVAEDKVCPFASKVCPISSHHGTT